MDLDLDKKHRRLKDTSGQRPPRVSVIMVTYNQAHLICEAIRSVYNQDYKDWEIVAVIDGSTDNTEGVVAEFGEPVRYIKQANQGLPGARNTGIRAARGEFIAILDADDLYESDYLSTLVSILESNPRADAVYCIARFADSANNPLPQRSGGVVAPEQLHERLLKGNFITPLCMFAYKYCYEQVGLFDESIPLCNDWDLWLQFSEKFTVLSTDRVLARYRVMPQSMSADPIPMLKDRLAVLNKYFGGRTSDTDSWTKTRKQAYGRVYLAAAIGSLQNDDPLQAYQYFREAVGVSPELVKELDVFYELGCGGQARGYRGHFASLDLKRNAQVIVDMLERLYRDPKTAPQLGVYRRQAFSNAYLALGLLNYGAAQFPEARRFLGRSIAVYPRSAFRSRVVLTMLKSLMDPKLVERLHRLRKRLQK